MQTKFPENATFNSPAHPNICLCIISGQKCYKCNRVGHLARDCQEAEERCYRCNDVGHKSRDCDRQKDEISCYNCKERGHLVRDCPTKVDVCFACNLEGHISRKFGASIYQTFLIQTPHFSSISSLIGNCPNARPKPPTQRQ